MGLRGLGKQFREAAERSKAEQARKALSPKVAYLGGHPASTRPGEGTLSFDGPDLTWRPRAWAAARGSQPFALPLTAVTDVDYKGAADLATAPDGYVKLLPFTLSGYGGSKHPMGYGKLTKLMTVKFVDEEQREHTIAFANRPASTAASGVGPFSENAADKKGLWIANELRAAAHRARTS
jgi:hypothetical protein